MGLLIHVLGWAGQGCYFLRFVVQWWASERAGRIVVPSLFWRLSLIGAVFGALYAGYEKDLVFLASPVVNFFIYARNLTLQRTGRSLPKNALIPLAIGIAALAAIALGYKIRPDPALPWLIVGTIGQLCWISRFPVQWWISERRGQALLPTAFLWISLVGSIFLLAYAIHTANPLFIVGMVLTPILYGRNLILAYKGLSVAQISAD